MIISYRIDLMALDLTYPPREMNDDFNGVGGQTKLEPVFYSESSCIDKAGLSAYCWLRTFLSHHLAPSTMCSLYSDVLGVSTNVSSSLSRVFSDERLC